MATLHDRDHDVSDYRERDRAYNDREDREISLGTGTILGIFFALALLCAVFFGFGYSMGRKSVQTAITAVTPQPASTGGIFSSFKPSAGSPSGSSVQAATNPKAETQETAAPPPRDPDSEIVTNPVTSSGNAPAPAKPFHAPGTKPAAETSSVNQPAFAAMPTITPSGTSMVQVAAVSHQEDADTLIAALKKKGYAVFIRNEPQDHLLHVQVGPFATRKDADTMRQHLLADGYNAIVK
jgi:DedD protein